MLSLFTLVLTQVGVFAYITNTTSWAANMTPHHQWDLVFGGDSQYDNWRFERSSSTVHSMVSLRGEASDAPATNIPDTVCPQWSRIDRIPEWRDPTTTVMMLEGAYGWPVLTIARAVRVVNRAEDYKTLSYELIGTGYIIPFISFRVLIPGIIVVWSLHFIFWVIFFISYPSLRYLIRNKRGLCLQCCYDLRGSTTDRCSECGKIQDDLRSQARTGRKIYSMILMCLAILFSVSFKASLDRTVPFTIASLANVSQIGSDGPVLRYDQILQDPQREVLLWRWLEECETDDEYSDFMYELGMMSDEEQDLIFLEVAEALIKTWRVSDGESSSLFYNSEGKLRCTDRNIQVFQLFLMYSSYDFDIVVDSLLQSLDCSNDIDIRRAALDHIRKGFFFSRVDDDSGVRGYTGEVQLAVEQLLECEDDPETAFYAIKFLYDQSMFTSEESLLRLASLLEQYPDLPQKLGANLVQLQMRIETGVVEQPPDG